MPVMASNNCCGKKNLPFPLLLVLCRNTVHLGLNLAGSLLIEAINHTGVQGL